MLRKIIAGFFLSVLAVPVCWFFIMQVRQLKVQDEMIEKLEKECLETIRVLPGQVQWYIQNKEIIVNNRLFDVKEFTIVQGVYVFKGLFDTKETAIKKAVSDANNSDPGNKLASRFFHFDNIHLSYQVLLVGIPFTLIVSHYQTTTNLLQSVSPEQIAPPPKC